MTTPSLPGIPCWIDMMTSDEAKTREFYTQLFGWTAGEASEEHGGYFMFLRDDKPVAGCMRQMPDDESPEEWTVYLAVEDARKTLEVALEAGAEEIVGAMDIPETGTMAVIADLAGARVGLWQASGFDGIEVRGEEGTQSWFELHTLDYDANVDFYRDVFGWDVHAMSDTPDFRYTTLGDGEAASAGINDASIHADKDFQSRWVVYIQVADTDATLEQAVALGGQIADAAQDSPYGRLAEIADPTGCRIKVMGPNLA